MKVILAGTIYGRGGIQSHVQWLAKALSEAKIETLIISLSNAKGIKEEPTTVTNLENEYVKVQVYNPSSDRRSLNNKIKSFFQIRRAIEQFSPDVYLAVGTGWNLYTTPLFLKSRHRLIFHEVMSGVPSGWNDSRWCVRGLFDEVVGQSQIVANTFKRYFGWRRSIAALPAIPEPLELTATLPQVQSRTIPFGTAKAALFSRLAPHKQALWLVKQWDVLKDYLAELHIHGTGIEETAIKAYIEQQEIGGRVKCFGCYPQGQAYVDLLSNYDLTLLPTIGAEGAPLVLLESMACGVPFVAYGVGGIPDYGLDNPNVLVMSPEKQDFISGVQQMCQLLAEGKINRPQLQQYYLDRYSFKVLKQAWLSYLTKS
jgi:glycosyltransferase involved in cell wall biosynthesis